MNTYRIHEDNIERLEKKLTRIRNKCIKYGCDFEYRQVGEEFDQITDENGNDITVRYILVECEGTAKVNGWRFLATLEHHAGGNVVHKLIDEVDVPERYWTCGPVCEHCNSARHRKETYIVYNEETNEYKQVGSSCLCDFTGGFSAEAAAEYIALYDSLIEGEAPMPGGHVESYYSTDKVLKYAIVSVKYLGYHSTEHEDPTKYRVRIDLDYDQNRGCLMKGQVEEVEKFRADYNPDYSDPELDTIIDDLKTYIDGEKDDSSYMHNLKLLLNEEYIAIKNFGYVVSAVSVYNKHLGRVEERRIKEEAHKQDLISQHVGTVGDRITIKNIANIETITSWTNYYGYSETTTIRYKITDTDGNIYMWDCSGYIDTDRDVVALTGTIKKHDEFRDVKQTWLTRCRVQYAEKMVQTKAPAPYNDEAERALGEMIDEAFSA